MRPTGRLRNVELRPLERVRSVKTKLGLLVVASIVATTLVVWLGLGAGWPPRYTLPLAVVAALVVTQLLAHGMTRPLREMTAAARNLTVAGGPVHVRSTSRDEVGELARAFSAMSAELSSADRQRRELLANVGHELRTPVAALRGQLENLVDGVAPADKRTLTASLGQAERLAGLVDDLLDLARLDAGPVVVHPQSIELFPFLDAAVAEAAQARPGRGWSVQVRPDDLVVRADPARLGQIAANLLDNAGRHARTWVSVTATARPGGVVIEVTDDGPGIPAADRARVFERFTSSPDGGGGTGLGLAIARWAVDLHGGHIRVADTPPDQPGCTILVDLPEEPDMTTVPHATAAPLLPPPPPGQRRSPVWPRPSHLAPGWLLVGALAAGLAAGGWLLSGPSDDYVFGVPMVVPGVNFALLGLLIAAPVVLVGFPAMDRWSQGLVALGITLSLTAAYTDTIWLVALTLLAGIGCTAVGLARSWGWLEVAFAPFAWAVAAVRAVPWASASVDSPRGGLRRSGPALRGLAIAAAAATVFALLLASADPAFDRIVQAVLPDVDLGSVPGRLIIGGFVAMATLGAGFLALAPPAWQRISAVVQPGGPRPGRPAAEWALPLGAVVVVVGAFVVVQATVLFGGHEVVLEGTGVTYAERARTGFGQLTAVTALTVVLLVICIRVAREQDRRLLLVLGGLLCGLSLVVVASALRRLALYEEVYGHTVARLVGGMLELWMALLILMCAAAAVWRGRWLPRAVVTSAALLLIGLVVLSPDRYVAQRNVDRFASTGTIDTSYASDLSADAVPALDRLPEPYRSCALVSRTAEDYEPATWKSWNLARAQAADVLADRAVEPQDFGLCTGLSSG